jgi:N-acetyl-alpha-D-muramate 1-phosphate uridylyltransferase
MAPATLPIAILAGGLGTRLLPRTERVPKALVEVHGRPFVDHQLALLAARGIDRVVLCVNHFGKMIEQHVGNGSAYGMRIAYSYDGAQALGTAGALKRAVPLLGEHFFVTYGDSYLPCDYTAIAHAYIASAKAGLMTVYRNDGRLVASNVLFRAGQIVAYDKEHPTRAMRYVDYGLSAFSADVFGDVPDDQATDLADVFEALIGRNELAGFESPTRFYEIGSPEGIAETEALLATGLGN